MDRSADDGAGRVERRTHARMPTPTSRQDRQDPATESRAFFSVVAKTCCRRGLCKRIGTVNGTRSDFSAGRVTIPAARRSIAMWPLNERWRAGVAGKIDLAPDPDSV